MSTETFTRDDLKNFIRNMKTLEEDQNSTTKVMTESVVMSPELDQCFADLFNSLGDNPQAFIPEVVRLAQEWQQTHVQDQFQSQGSYLPES